MLGTADDYNTVKIRNTRTCNGSTLTSHKKMGIIILNNGG